MSEYSQGICSDGAAILKDGQPMTIEEILAELRAAPQPRTVAAPKGWKIQPMDGGLQIAPPGDAGGMIVHRNDSRNGWGLNTLYDLAHALLDQEKPDGAAVDRQSLIGYMERVYSACQEAEQKGFFKEHYHRDDDSWVDDLLAAFDDYHAWRSSATVV